MLVIYRIVKSRPTAGFTLLELLVVLVLISLLTGLALPRLASWYSSLEMAYTRDDALARLGSLGYQAFQQGRDFTLTHYPLVEGAPPIPLELPAGWQLYTDAPIHYYGNGLCGGGTVHLFYGGQKQRLAEYTVQLDPPFCQVQAH
ncbi:MAG: hypothetical protein BWK79_11630 [Beggiatoa sp. IS2]|nr:MAG: hypothetical protein BWK79_11630 [Beggiatoa sp. IS2]